jgi:hypothetical protein
MDQVTAGPHNLVFSLRLLFLVATLSVCAQNAPSEFEVKAAFLLNFTRFLEWSESDLPANAPLNICIVGDDPFGRTLDQLVEGEAVQSHPIEVVRLKSPGDGTCHVMYFSRPTKDAVKVLPSVRPGILTVGEDSEFLRGGGMVAFVIENRRVRFDVNIAVMRKGGVRASSRLLSVARSVKP